MTAPADFYQEVDPFESYDGLEFADEAKMPFAPGRRVFVPGGLNSATLNTPKGPAKLNLPAAVPTLAQFRALEQALNSVTQRLNATNTQLLQVRRELATKKTDQSGTMSMLIPFIMQRKLRSDLDGHTHGTDGPKPTFPADSGKLDTLLPLLLLQPNLFGGATGGATGGTQAAGSSDSISPLIQMMLIMEIVK